MFPENHRNFFSYLFFHLAEILEITWFAWYIIIWAAHKQLTNQKRCSHCPMLHLYMEALWIWILQKSCALWEVPKDMPVPLLSCFTLQDNSHQNSHEMVLLHVPFLPALCLTTTGDQSTHCQSWSQSSPKCSDTETFSILNPWHLLGRCFSTACTSDLPMKSKKKHFSRLTPDVLNLFT